MTSCAFCNLIRLFLFMAAGLMFMMAAFPDALQPLLSKIPGPMAVALIVPAIGVPGFIIKYRRWKNDQQS
jgi:hypothetical protein